MAGVPVEWHYHQTTIDPPELVRFLRKEHEDVIWDRPKRGNFFRRAEVKGFPTRMARWCCDEYKEESKTNGRPMILGVRISESRGRKARWTSCTMPHHRSGSMVVLPIRLWDDDHVWEFIRWRRLPYCSLYDEGFNRLGCVGCPLASARIRKMEFARWPAFERQWKRVFERIWTRRVHTLQRDGREWFGSRTFLSWENLFNWWNDGQPNITQWHQQHGLQMPQKTNEATRQEATTSVAPPFAPQALDDTEALPEHPPSRSPVRDPRYGRTLA